ncbi:hypothetical protein QNI19_11460 [Cytophagaceae bacterium DM2B3-1]|uniref:LemA family protein n=1 Tax=Xanthocytophaga flava TaxID=3048013 RepID=A0ABT7CKK8_9BACT|nr:hypothetical protein [Xanthocytophaga flavus]MDJ1493552.1 hypothetical protein [Xanthocytophaga flavus]
MIIFALFAFKVTGIGVLPILLVITGAIFLWGMVVLNSLRTRKSNTDIYLQNVGKVAFQRVQLLIQLGELLNTNLVVDQEGYNETKLAAETRTIAESIENLGFADNNEANRLQTALSQNASLLLQTQKKFRSARGNYNELCKQMPYRIIASLFGFKPLAV